jgi:hypothetical protein
MVTATAVGVVVVVVAAAMAVAVLAGPRTVASATTMRVATITAAVGGTTLVPTTHGVSVGKTFGADDDGFHAAWHDSGLK